MAEQSVQSLLDDTYRMVRVHGWCAQSYQLLDELHAAVSGSQESSRHLEAEARRRLATVESNDERVLSLGVLHDTGSGAADLAELAYRHLDGRLSTQGFVFFQRYLFDNLSPIPEQITYEITQRVFISFQRAVFQAMQISEFTSDFEPEQVALYLTLLLCRNSLNEQNRAMVFLLLSRIDAPLPPGIRNAVASGMRDLRDVVREVEERKESVLSDTLRPETERATVDWEVHRGLPQEPAAPAPGGLTNASTRVSKRERADFAVPEPETPERRVPREADPARSEVMNQRTDILPDPLGQRQAMRAPAQTTGRRPSRRQRAPLPEGIGDDRSTGPKGAELSQPEGGARERADLATQMPTPRPPGAREPDSQKAETRRARRAEGRLFAIKFSRQTSELAALLETVREVVERVAAGPTHEDRAPQAKAAEPDPAAAAAPAPADAPGAVPTGLPAKRRSVRFWIVFAAILLALGVGTVIVLASRDRGSPETPSPPVPAAPSQPGPAVPAPAAPMDAQPEPEPPSGSTAGPRLVVEGSGLTWYPQAGDSLWRLYNYVRTTPDAPGELGTLAARGWQAFLARVSSLNPDMEVPDLIQPNGPIVVVRAVQ
jgi:hypothetical protein